MFVVEENRIYFHCINMIYFFMVLVWFLCQVMDVSISPDSADLSEVAGVSALFAFLCHRLASYGWMA